MTPYGLGARISPYAHPHDVARSITLAAVKQGAAKDPKGDTVLAQINPHEVAMLIAAGGSGRIDPRTGIQHFDPSGGSNAGGAGHAGDGGDGGGDGGGNNGGGISGGDARMGAPSSGNAYGGGYTGNTGGGNGSLMGGASGAYNSVSQLGIRDPITSASLANQGMYSNDSGPLGLVGRALLGLGYMDPTAMNLKGLMAGQAPPSTPDTGFDAPGMALGIGGMFAGMPLGAAYYGAKKALGASSDFGMVDVGNWGNMNSSSGTPGMNNAGGNNGSNNGQGNNGGRPWMPPAVPGVPPGAPGGQMPPPAPAVPPAPPQVALPPGVLPPQPFIPPGQNPYMPWRQFMAYQNPANLGALPFATPGQPGA